MLKKVFHNFISIGVLFISNTSKGLGHLIYKKGTFTLWTM